jgi:4'-phosphopantetheinyl transferase
MEAVFANSRLDSAVLSKTIQPEGKILHGGDIHVWTIGLDGLDTHLSFLNAVLTEDERVRAARLRSETVRQRFVAGRAALRTILSRYAACPPSQLILGHGEHGKPYLRWPHVKLKFNLSHSGGLALAAVSDGIELGIDVEAIHPLAEMDTIMTHYFSAAEKEQLDRLPAFQKPEGFFNAWTRKEAYVKGTGGGFSLPLDCFSVSLVPGKPARLLDIDEKQPGSDGWRLANLAPAAGVGYCAALAYRSNTACRIIYRTFA